MRRLDITLIILFLHLGFNWAQNECINQGGECLDYRYNSKKYNSGSLYTKTLLAKLYFF